MPTPPFSLPLSLPYSPTVQQGCYTWAVSPFPYLVGCPFAGRWSLFSHVEYNTAVPSLRSFDIRPRPFIPCLVSPFPLSLLSNSPIPSLVSYSLYTSACLSLFSLLSYRVNKTWLSHLILIYSQETLR